MTYSAVSQRVLIACRISGVFRVVSGLKVTVSPRTDTGSPSVITTVADTARLIQAMRVRVHLWRSETFRSPCIMRP